MSKQDPFSPARIAGGFIDSTNRRPNPLEGLDVVKRRINQVRGPAVKFVGALVAENSFISHDDGGFPFELNMEIWLTIGGAFIAVTSSERFTRVTVCEPIDATGMERDPLDVQCAVMEAFDWNPRARMMVREKLGWKLVREVA